MSACSGPFQDVSSLSSMAFKILGDRERRSRDVGIALELEWNASGLHGKEFHHEAVSSSWFICILALAAVYRIYFCQALAQRDRRYRMALTMDRRKPPLSSSSSSGSGLSMRMSASFFILLPFLRRRATFCCQRCYAALLFILNLARASLPSGIMVACELTALAN